MTSDIHDTIEIRELGVDDIDLIHEIDRSERIDTLYTVENGRLRGEPTDLHVPPWDREGDGEHSSARRIAELRPIVKSGATLLGAFVAGEFAGIAIVDPTFEGSLAWFAFLHVSRTYRRQGVAAALWANGLEVAAATRATSIYAIVPPQSFVAGTNVVEIYGIAEDADDGALLRFS